jgi:cyclophilin family peptidyl-prolyl cis-trans isomerase
VAVIATPIKISHRKLSGGSMQKVNYTLFSRLLLVSLVLLSQAFSANAYAENPQVKLQTDMGDILLELYPEQAPISVDNFIKLANSFHYDGLIFHRVIKGFMIQSGGHTFDLTVRESERPPIINESFNGLSNGRGTISMARTGDPDSAKAQFFINHGNNKSLNARGAKAGYAVFGSVIKGMDVVDAIAETEVANKGMYQNVPVTAIRILTARLVNPDAWKPLAEPKKLPAFEKPIPIR